MHSDYYFTKGKDHFICEDYAFAGVAPNGFPYAIVADGCTTATDTDIGARLLVRSLSRQIDLGKSFDLRDAIHRASHIANALGLDPACLMATVLCAQAGPKGIDITLTGDGALVARRRETKEIVVWWVNFPSGAPEYLCYITSKDKHKQYRETFGSTKIVELYNIKEDDEDAGNWEPIRFKDQLAIKVHLNYAFYDVVGLLTDGAATFDKEVFSKLDVIKALMKFKNVKGEFVKRRMRRFLKDCRLNDIEHYDDIAMAAMYIEDE